jgi:sedoheptulose-bisphosphatase
MVCQYGPRITVALAIGSHVTKDGNAVSMELTMNGACWVVSHAKFAIRETAKTFAPGNLRATADNPQYMALFNYYLANQYTLRYSGGLVPDVYHILIKGQGVLINACSPKAKAKLRLLFECAPIALIIEAAGGASCVCSSEFAEPCEPISILDVVATDMDKRIGVCYGSRAEVERFKAHIFA